MNSVNIAVIVDRSGSVENEKIPLEDSINLLMESFKRKYLENTSLRLLLVTLENNDILIQEKDFKNVYDKHAKRAAASTSFGGEALSDSSIQVFNERSSGTAPSGEASN